MVEELRRIKHLPKKELDQGMNQNEE